MGRVYDDPGDDHEGWLATILPDGTDTGSYSNDTPPAVGHRPACACGWRGTSNYDHPGEHFLDEGPEDDLMVEWEAHIDVVRDENQRRDLIANVRVASAAVIRRAREARAGGIGWDEIEAQLWPIPSGPVRRAVEPEDQPERSAGRPAREDLPAGLPE